MTNEMTTKQKITTETLLYDDYKGFHVKERQVRTTT